VELLPEDGGHMSSRPLERVVDAKKCARRWRRLVDHGAVTAEQLAAILQKAESMEIYRKTFKVELRRRWCHKGLRISSGIFRAPSNIGNAV
jgi:hypothetical protein